MAIDYTKQLKRINGVIVPQYWNDAIQDWEVVQGSNGAYSTDTPTKVTKEPFSSSANLTKEFATEMQGFVISNDGDATLTFTILGETFTVKAGEVFESDYPNFSSVGILSTVPFRAYGKAAISGLGVITPTDTTAPNNATNPLASNVAETSLTLAWTASNSSDCTGYDIYRGSTLLGSVTGVTYNATGLTQATQYTFTIKAKDAANNIATGTSITTTTAATPADTTPPTNVSSVTTSNVTQTSLTLSWSVSSSSDVASYEVYQGSTLLGTVTGTTYNATSLTASTSYTFTVKAKDNSNNIATGTSVTISTSAQPADSTPPTDVTGLASSNIAASGVTLTWVASASSDIQDYRVYNGTTLITTVTGVTYNVTGLSASTAYTFVVKARDTSNNEAIGVSANVTTSAPADITAPNNATSLIAGSVTATSLTLSWTASNSTDIASYDVFNGVTLLGNATTTSFNVIGLTEKTEYTFTVKAKDTSNNVASGISVTIATSDITAPANVTSLTTASVTETTLMLNWTASVSSDVASYDVYNGATLLGNVTVATYNVTGLTASTTYTFWVKAKDVSNNVASGTSVNVTTSAVADTTAPNPVTGLIAGTPTSSAIPVNWTLSDSGDVANYEVAYSTDGTNFTVASSVVNSSSTAYTVTGLTASTLYTIRVVAIDGAGNRSTAVTAQETTVADGQPIGINLFIPATVTAGQSVNSSTGALVATAGWNASDYIVLEEREVYTASLAVGNRAYYKNDQTYSANAGSVQSGSVFVGTLNWKHVRISVQDANLNTFTVLKIGAQSLLDYTTVLANTGLSTTGATTTSSGYNITAYMPVTSGETYVFPSGVIYKSEYGSSQEHIATNTTQGISEMTVGATTNFVRISYPNSLIQNVFFIKKIVV